MPLDTTIGESPAITAFRDRLRPVLDRAARLSRPPGKDLAANVLHVAGRGTGQYVYLHSTCDPFVGLSAGPGLWKRAVAGPI